MQGSLHTRGAREQGFGPRAGRVTAVQDQVEGRAALVTLSTSGAEGSECSEKKPEVVCCDLPTHLRPDRAL
ncbi:hypothetical protein GCM10008019_44550 [Deinococcus soli (ex Cha et al. 2016)]|nr:hypothetical protein GCM10008019_44550 [Deinococcus soli (ex Cha et al. 2016)]